MPSDVINVIEEFQIKFPSTLQVLLQYFSTRNEGKINVCYLSETVYHSSDLVIGATEVNFFKQLAVSSKQLEI